MNSLTILWIVFWITFVSVSAMDLFVITHRKTAIDVKVALRWTTLWIAVAFGFAAVIYFLHPTGAQTSMLFVSGYLTEYSLSVDNLFVFILIFALMGVKQEAQPKLIKLGIYLSIVLRIVFILVGVALVEKFSWLLYLFGALLIWTAWKMLMTDEDESVHPDKNILYKLGARFLPMHKGDHGRHIAVKIDGRWGITALFLVFLVIGSTDVLFAIDSIPAIMGISTDPFVVITSNVFAVLGLNSLFFAIRGIMGLFKFLKHGVSLILFFIGAKMILPGVGKLLVLSGLNGFGHALEHSEHWFKEHTWVSLTVIGVLLVGAIVVSVVHERLFPAAATETAG